MTFPVDRTPAIDVAHAIHSLLPDESGTSPPVLLDASSGLSEIWIEPGIRRLAGELIRERWPKSQRIWLISDDNVGPAHGNEVETILKNAGLTVERVTVPSGETSKSLTGATRVYDQMLEGRVERSDLVLALGGGVVGDLAGFIAATVLRGVGLRANANFAVGDGRFERWRQDRYQSPGRKKSHRCFLPAAIGHHRSRLSLLAATAAAPSGLGRGRRNTPSFSHRRLPVKPPISRTF